MAYNFDKIWERSGCDATKWDSPRKPQCQVYTEAESFVPMWIADMDFATPDFVVEAMKERMEHPIFGYFATPKRYFDAIRFWQRERYGVSYEIENGNIMYQNSVLGGVASFLSVYTLPGEAVLLNSPCYTAFQTTIHNLGRKICASELVKDGDGIYRMNFDEMERMMVETDAPYLTPVPFRGKRNDSGYVHLVAEKIAQLKGLPAEQVERQTWENGVRFFGIPQE